MNGDCEGNCGAMFDDGDSWKILPPDDGRELEFCSLACMASWIASEYQP